MHVQYCSEDEDVTADFAADEIADVVRWWDDTDLIFETFRDETGWAFDDQFATADGFSSPEAAYAAYQEMINNGSNQ